MKRVLGIIDVQNDFGSKGALSVPHAEEIIPVINKLMSRFDLIVATQDWHPVDHQSFAVQHNKKPGEVIKLSGADQVLWPVHCVQGTWGAEFIPGLDVSRFNFVVRKGTDRMIDSYSGFFDNMRMKATGMEAYLREAVGSDCEFYVAGLVTDYCVKYTVLDACSLGFKTFVIADACRGIDLHPGGIQKAFDEMSAAGATIVDSQGVVA